MAVLRVGMVHCTMVPKWADGEQPVALLASLLIDAGVLQTFDEEVASERGVSGFPKRASSHWDAKTDGYCVTSHPTHGIFLG